jgi:hypothetical protein
MGCAIHQGRRLNFGGGGFESGNTEGLVAFPGAAQCQAGYTIGQIRKSIRRLMGCELCQLMNLCVRRIRTLENALKHSKTGLFVGTFKRQTKCGAADHGRVKNVRPIGDHDKRYWCGARGQLIDLLDEYVDARTILVMRLHLTATSRQIVCFIDNKNGPTYCSGTCFGLCERLCHARREFADMPASAYIGGRFQANDALIDRAGDRRRDAGGKGRFATTNVAGKKNEGKRRSRDFQDAKAVRMMTLAPIVKSLPVQHQGKFVRKRLLDGIDAKKAPRNLLFPPVSDERFPVNEVHSWPGTDSAPDHAVPLFGIGAITDRISLNGLPVGPPPALLGEPLNDAVISR